MTDRQGNVRNTFYYDASNNPILGAAYWYDPFGKQVRVWVAGTNQALFTYNFKELDDEASFNDYYYGARFYDPAIGRFLSPDPVKGYTNPYSYVANNPIAFTDPTGMAPGTGGGGGQSWGWQIGPPGFDNAPDAFGLDVLLGNRIVVTAIQYFWSLVGNKNEQTGGNTSDEKPLDPEAQKRLDEVNAILSKALQHSTRESLAREICKRAGGLNGFTPEDLQLLLGHSDVDPNLWQAEQTNDVPWYSDPYYNKTETDFWRRVLGGGWNDPTVRDEWNERNRVRDSLGLFPYLWP